MLCKLVRQKKVLRGIQWGMVFLGVVMLGTCLVLGSLGRLEGELEGFYLGAGTGLAIGGLALRLVDWWRRRTPERNAQEDLNRQDERNQEINRRAGLSAGVVQLLALCGVMLTAYPWSRTVFWLAFALVVLDALAYLAAFAYFWRKL